MKIFAKTKWKKYKKKLPSEIEISENYLKGLKGPYKNYVTFWGTFLREKNR